MAPGALDAVTKEMIYVAISVEQSMRLLHCLTYCFRKEKRMTDQMFRELMAVVGMANETNRLVAGYQVDIDPQFKT